MPQTPLNQGSPPSVVAEVILPGLCCRTRGSFTPQGRALPPEPSPGCWVGVPSCPSRPPGHERVPGAPFGLLIPHQQRGMKSQLEAETSVMPGGCWNGNGGCGAHTWAHPPGHTHLGTHTRAHTHTGTHTHGHTPTRARTHGHTHLGTPTWAHPPGHTHGHTHPGTPTWAHTHGHTHTGTHTRARTLTIPWHTHPVPAGTPVPTPLPAAKAATVPPARAQGPAPSPAVSPGDPGSPLSPFPGGDPRHSRAPLPPGHGHRGVAPPLSPRNPRRAPRQGGPGPRSPPAPGRLGGCVTRGDGAPQKP
ncbi:uncharacterized protein LOC143695742 [Agelaius phoeniceus]|uniref:uncharacterized protein LOC143695742 n=1 Tax=Agelaius phoeniceus TaxID=39638 RepID=UPI004054C021